MMATACIIEGICYASYYSLFANIIAKYPSNVLLAYTVSFLEGKWTSY